MLRPPLDPEPCDVLIVGGGAAGWAAAYAAITAGAHTMLIERSDRLGGKATNAMVGTICGAFLRSFGKEPLWALHGAMREVCAAIGKASGKAPEQASDGLWYWPYAVDAFEGVLRSFEPRVAQQSRFNTSLVSCTAERGITEVRLLARQGEYDVAPKTVVDCTGNALVSRACNAPLLAEERYQAPSQVLHVSGVKGTGTDAIVLAIQRAMLRARENSDVRVAEVKQVGPVHGSFSNGSMGLKVTLQHRIQQDEDLVALNERGRRAAHATVMLLRETTDAFRETIITSIAPEIGVRTEQRPVGGHILTGTEVLSGAKPVDGVALGAWPIEHWGDGPGADMQWLPEGAHYLIPIGSLRSATMDNLYFAGRGISADEMAIASARVIATCLSTGYAAGILAAYRALGRAEHEAVQRLRNEQLPH